MLLVYHYFSLAVKKYKEVSTSVYIMDKQGKAVVKDIMDNSYGHNYNHTYVHVYMYIRRYM